MTFYEQALITVLKIMVFTNLFGMAAIIWCLANIFAPKPPKIVHGNPEVRSIIMINDTNEYIWVAPDGTETMVERRTGTNSIYNSDGVISR